MKHLLKFSVLMVVAANLLSLHSCTKKEAEAGPQLTQQLASPTIVAELRALGMEIIETGKPVQIEGIYEIKPEVLTATNIPDDYEVGHVFEDPYKFQFSNQNESQQNITIKYRDDKGISQSAEGFVAGSGNKFTVISVGTYSKENATLKSMDLVSGEWTSNGIKDLQYAFYILEKNDPDSLFLDVGHIRVSEDQDGLASKVASLRLPADEAQEENKELSGRKVQRKK